MLGNTYMRPLGPALAIGLLAAATAAGCGSSHTSGDAGPRADTGPVADGGPVVTCGDSICRAGQTCCPGCTPGEGFCGPAGAGCPPIACPPPPPVWRDCDEAMAYGSPGDPCVGDWSCGGGDGCCYSMARCVGGVLEREEGCAPGCGGCATNADCLPRELCLHPSGTCGGPGVCEPRPEGCTADCPGVCGCDGTTYCNACNAAAAGVGVSDDRSLCDVPPPGRVCGTRGAPPCPSMQFCDFTPNECGAADVPGVCRPSPDACPFVYDPVCGCDGVTHENECAANAAGVDIVHRGECADPPDCRMTGCAAGMYCTLCWADYACIPEGAVC